MSRASPGERGAVGPAAVGFTLLEVMVALVILAGGLVAASDLAGAALRNHEQARDLSAAVLLARGKMAQLEEKYEDSGFRDFDEEDQGDFGEEGRPDVRWRVELLRPDPDLSAERLIAILAGASGTADSGELVQKLLGAQAAPGAAGAAMAAGGPQVLATVTGLLQTQLASFGEAVKKSLREMRLTVSWPAGKQRRSFTVVTHLVVLNPRAPGGGRGDAPDVPSNLAAAATAARLPAALGAIPGAPAGTPAAVKK